MAARWPFWKWHRWKSIGFCLWPPSTCIWNLKLKFQSKLDLCSGNHVVYRQTDRRTDKVNPVYPPPTSLGGGIKSKSPFIPNPMEYIILTQSEAINLRQTICQVVTSCIRGCLSSQVKANTERLPPMCVSAICLKTTLGLSWVIIYNS